MRITTTFSIKIRFVYLYIAFAFLSGCAALPGLGPTAMEISLHEKAQDTTDGSNKTDEKYILLSLNAKTVRALGQYKENSVSQFFKKTNNRYDSSLKIGDKLTINIWESSSDGLFSSLERKQTQLSSSVDERGRILIPYIGHLTVLNKNIEQVRKLITDGLTGKAVEPQVQLVLQSRSGGRLSVIGDVKNTGRFEVPINGIKLIEALALAGGSKFSSYETDVKVVRGRKSTLLRLDNIVRYSGNNIWMKPGDIVQVLHKPRSFSAFGAITKQNQQQFKTSKVSLAEALAQSGGLKDNFSDAGGVFLFRMETRARLKKVGKLVKSGSNHKLVPTIYRLDFNEPQAFFYASRFMMKDKDIIYIANAPTVEFNKFISSILSPVLPLA